MESQNKMILAHLRKYKHITPLEALERYGCMRLASRIFDLRESGHQIAKQMVVVGKKQKRVAQYSIIQEA